MFFKAINGETTTTIAMKELVKYAVDLKHDTVYFPYPVGRQGDKRVDDVVAFYK